MRSKFLSILPLATETLALPFTFPLITGFPFPDDASLEDPFTRARGNFSNVPLVPKFDDDSLTRWKLQAVNEYREWPSLPS